MINFKQVELELLEADRKLEKMSIDDVLEEWRTLSKKQALLKSLVEYINEDIGSLESFMTEFAKRSDAQTAAVNEAILTFKERKGRKNVKYADALKAVMLKVNKQTQAVIAEAVEEFTTLGDSKELVDVLDPQLEIFLQDLKLAPKDELLDKLGNFEKHAKTLAKKVREEKIDESSKALIIKAKNAIKNLAQRLTSKIKKWFNPLDGLVDDLNKVNSQFA